MEVQIRPEPDEDEREAIVAALAQSGVEPQRPSAYDSRWRAAGLRDAADPQETDENEP